MTVISHRVFFKIKLKMDFYRKLRERRKDQREDSELRIEELKKESNDLWHLHFRVSESSIWSPVTMKFPAKDKLKSEELEIPYLIKKKWESILYDEAVIINQKKMREIANLENLAIIFYAETEDNSILEVISDKRTENLEIVMNDESTLVNADHVSNLVFVLREWLDSKNGKTVKE